MPDEPTLTKVHEDERGTIYAITLGDPDQELLLIHSKAGSLRGGHAHNCNEITTLLLGRMTYHKVDSDGKPETLELLAGQHNVNVAGMPHMAEFREDSWIIDWRLGTPTSKIVTTNYKPLRDRVEAQA